MARVTVIGAGSWGTALAIVLADNDHQVNLWTHRKTQAEEINRTHKNKQYLDVMMPENIIAYHQLDEAINNIDAIVLAVPTKAIRDVCKQLEPILHPSTVVIHAVKGIESNTLNRISEMIAEELTNQLYEDIVVLGGPSHAEEVAMRQPTTVTVSSENKQNLTFAQDVFMNQSFRVYTSRDLIGTELGGALKNIIALGAGISDGLGYGDNAKAALMTRGLAEITRLAVDLGANPLTFLGLPGVGDLIVTCTSTHSRNWRAGQLLGSGYKVNDVLDHMGMVVEGINTTKAAYHLAKGQEVDMPIVTGMYDILFNEQHPKEVVDHLMNRSKREELDDLT